MLGSLSLFKHPHPTRKKRERRAERRAEPFNRHDDPSETLCDV
jgi:hypothetical protein